LDNNSPKTIDWPAIRAAYETGAETVRIIAELYGVSHSMIDRRRAKEAWPRRSDTGRIAPRPPKVDQVDWPAVRHDYESGEYPVSEVARRHGCSRSRLQQQKDLEHWQARRPAYPRAYGAGGKVAALQRFKAGLAQKLGILASQLGLAEKLDVSEPLKALNTLAAACEKLLEVREKSGDDSNRLHINDATRDALAVRLEALARSWERRRDSAGTGSKGAGAD
jgi:transposase-like protein